MVNEQGQVVLDENGDPVTQVVTGWMNVNLTFKNGRATHKMKVRNSGVNIKFERNSTQRINDLEIKGSE